MPVNFDLNDLYAFRALVEYGNFRIAAESICISQSALSRRIEKLEAAVGAKLFDRTTRRVTLTLFGQTFAERCGVLLENVESMLADIDKVSEERTGLITVATVPSAACHFMPEVIRQFHSRYPRVRIKLIDSSAGNVIEAVASGQADFGICFARSLQPEIAFIPLVEDVYVAACRRDHPLAGRKNLTWQAFFSRITSAWISPPETATCSTRCSATSSPSVRGSVKRATSPRCWGWWRRGLALRPFPRCQCRTLNIRF